MREIDAICFQGYKLIKKKDKDSEKNKSADIPLINAPSGKQ